MALYVNGIRRDVAGLDVANTWTALQTFSTIKITGGSPGAGKVLTSDADGDATWEAAAGGGNTLDGAYDQGGAGAGRTITADSGAVAIQGTGGLLVTGKGGIGTIGTIAGQFQVADTVTTSPRGLVSSQHNTGTDGARLHLRKSRGTNASPTVIATNDNLGRLIASGYDGSNYLEMGAIEVKAVGTIAATRVPTEMSFWTATDAAPSVLTQRMVIDNQGRVGIGRPNPLSELHVHVPNTGSQLATIEIGNGPSSNTRFLITNKYATYTWMGWGDDPDLLTFRLGAPGKIGINQPNPDKVFEVTHVSDAQLRLSHTVSTHFTDVQTDGSGNFTITPSGSNIIIPDAKNIQLNVTTGTKFGTATTQKLAFFNATPVSQQTHIADPTGGATVDAEARTAINAILVLLETFGFKATS